MLEIRRISTSRWWRKKKSWTFLGIFLFLVLVRISKGSIYKDIYYFISKIASTSTAILRGNEGAPTANLACHPLSSKIEIKNLDAPSITNA